MDRPWGYLDRQQAGEVLAKHLHAYAGRDDVLILALPRGGVAVASVVAAALNAPMDVMVVRKLRLPEQPEYAMGAIASGDVVVLNEEVTGPGGVSGELVNAVIDRERQELIKREAQYRGHEPAASLRGRCVILVDDGLATGSSMRAAVRAAWQQGAQNVIVAVPVAPRPAVDMLTQQADAVICPLMPQHFYAVGQWYEQFSQVRDEEVQRLLAQASHAN
jgi:predicted phosphoribosyltransferase